MSKKQLYLDCFQKSMIPGCRNRSKINKNLSKIYSKSIEKWTSIFDASWRPTWLPKPTQNPPKIDRKSIKNRIKITSKFCYVFGLLFGASWTPTWVNLGPTWAQLGSTWAQLGPNLGQLGPNMTPTWPPKRGQLGPNLAQLSKNPPRPPQDP